MFYILAAMIIYSIVILLATFASRNTNSNLVAAIVNVVSTIIPLAVVLPILNKKLIVDSRLGIFFALLAGVGVALFTLALNKSFTVNKVGIVTPIVFGGAIFLSTLLGSYFFKEKISLLQGSGLVLMGIGLSIIIYVKATAN